MVQRPGYIHEVVIDEVKRKAIDDVISKIDDQLRLDAAYGRQYTEVDIHLKDKPAHPTLWLWPALFRSYKDAGWTYVTISVSADSMPSIYISAHERQVEKWYRSNSTGKYQLPRKTFFGDQPHIPLDPDSQAKRDNFIDTAVILPVIALLIIGVVILLAKYS